MSTSNAPNFMAFTGVRIPVLDSEGGAMDADAFAGDANWSGMEREVTMGGWKFEHRFNDADKWSRVFDDPKRDAWQKPHEVITSLKLAPDAVVADIGAGTGYFAARLAHLLASFRSKVANVLMLPDAAT